MLIKHIPNIFEKEGRAEYPDVEWVGGKSVADYCRETIGKQSGYKAIINGGVADWDYQPLKSDEIIFTPDVKGKGSIISTVIGVVIFAVGVYAGGNAFLMGMGASMVLGGVVSGVAHLMTPEVSAGDDFQDSKTYSWGGIQNIYGEGSYLPVVLGRHRIGGAVLERYVETNFYTETVTTTHHAEYEGYPVTWTTTEDITEAKDELSLLIGLSEGPVLNVHSDSLHFNRQPLSLFDDGILEGPYTRKGNPAQSEIPGFSTTRHYYGMTTPIELVHNSGYVYKINNNAVRTIRIHLTFPALVRIKSSGSLRWRHVDFLIQHSQSENGPWSTVNTLGVGAKSTSEYNRDHQSVMPSAGGYIRITRLTENDINETRLMSDSFLKAITEIEPASVAYVNTALIGMKVTASELVSGGMPTVSTLVDGVEIADVRTGTIDLTSIRNPANVIWEILTNKRWGAGRHITEEQIDVASLQELADWCDELVPHTTRRRSLYGGWHTSTINAPKYQIGFIIDKEFRVINLIEKICASCRATPFWAGNKLKFVIDREQAGYAQTFTMGNIIEDSFEEVFSKVEVPTQIEAEYLDEDDDFKKKIIIAIDKERVHESPIIKRINMFGMTSRARVKREIAYVMRKLKAYNNEITFRASIDGVICEVGDLIRFQHDVPQYGYGGRVIDVDGNFVTLDQNVPFPAGVSCTLRVRRQDDNTYFINNGLSSGSDTVMQVINVGSGHNIKINDVWTFGPNGLDFRPYRVLAITKASDQEVSITAENYNPSVHDDTAGTVIYENKYSLLGLTTSFNIDGSVLAPIPEFDHDHEHSSAYAIPPFVLSLVLSESRELVGNAWVSFISVSFTPVSMPPNSGAYISRYDVLYSTDGFNWQSAGTASGHSASISGVEKGQLYYVIVKPYTNMGVTNNIEGSSYRRSHAITIGGDLSPPMPPSGLTVTGGNFCNHLSWVNPENMSDLSGIEIWAAAGQNNRDGAILVRTILSDNWTHYDLNHNVMYYYWIRGIDSSGNVGPWYPANPLGGIGSTPITDPALIVDRLYGSISIDELTTPLSDRIDLIDYPVTGLLDVTSALQAEMDVLQAEMSDIQGLPDFDENNDYDEGVTVKYEGGLYLSLQAITAPSPLPTDEAYWEKIGDYASLAEAISAHAVTLEQHGTRITQAEGGITVNAQDITALAARTTDAEGGITANTSAISGMETTISNIEGEVSAVSGEVTQLQADLNAAEGDITANATAIGHLQTSVSNMDGQITIMSSNISTLTSDLSAAEGDISTNATAISGLQTSVTDIGGQITTISSDISSLESELSAAEGDISTNATAIGTLQTSVSDIDGQVTTLSANVSSLASDLSSVEGDVSANGTAIGNLQTSVSGLDGQITAVASDVTTLTSELNDAEEDIATNAGAIGTLYTEVSNLDATVTAVAIQANEIEATVDGHSASITQNATALATLDGQVKAEYSVMVNVNNRVTGFKNMITGSGQSTFDILADKFRIVSQNDNNDVKYPFVVVNNAVGINGELIVNGTVTALTLKVTGTNAVTADTIPESASRKYAAESGADVTGTKTALDTTYVAGENAATVRNRAATGANHAGTTHAPSNADVTQTVIDGGLITTGIIRNHAASPTLEINFNNASISVNTRDGLVINSNGGIRLNNGGSIRLHTANGWFYLNTYPWGTDDILIISHHREWASAQRAIWIGWSLEKNVERIAYYADSHTFYGDTLKFNGDDIIPSKASGGIGAYRLMAPTLGTSNNGLRGGSELRLSYGVNPNDPHSAGLWATTNPNSTGTWRQMSGHWMGAGTHGIFVRIY